MLLAVLGLLRLYVGVEAETALLVGGCGRFLVRRRGRVFTVPGRFGSLLRSFCFHLSFMLDMFANPSGLGL
jgi:hypothetical protein